MAAVKVSFCMAAVILSLVTSGAHAQDYVFRATSFPYPFYYQDGGDVIVSCWFNSSLQFRYWLHPTLGIISVSQGRAILENLYGVVSLRILNAGQDDNGEYFCVCNLGARPLTTNAISANIRLPIELHVNSTNVTVGVGQSHRFSCNASNVLRLQWIHFTSPDEVPTVLISTTDGKIKITRSHELQLRDVQYKDDGIYQCLLTNNLMRVTISHILKVVDFPVASVQDSYLEVMEGQSASLVCFVSGNPLPDITWRDRMDAVLQNAEGVTVTTEMLNSTSKTSVLRFDMVLGSTTGPYTCRAVNVYDHFSQASTYLRLTGTPEPPQNVMLEIVDFTNIRVSWTPPQSAVDTYVIMWKAVDRSSTAAVYLSLVVVASGQRNSAVLTGLDRLTNYHVFLYANNSQGMSLDSEVATITTSATVPSVPRGVVVLDIGPTSALVEWPLSFHPADDGGAPLQLVRLTPYLVEEKKFVDTNFTMGLEEEFVIISGLVDDTMYRIKMEFGNTQGFGPGLLSNVFSTPLPGTPGSPIHVVARNVTETTAIVCWVDSLSGMPFLRYKFEVTKSGKHDLSFWQDVSTVTSFPSIPGCSKGVMVNTLKSESCYIFRVTVSNKVANGQPSQASEEVCTLPSSYVTEDNPAVLCNSSSSSDGMRCLKSGSVLLVSIGVSFSFVLLVLVVTVMACILLRWKMKKTLKNRGHDIDTSRRESKQSMQSTSGLLPFGRNLSSSTSSSHSPNLSPGNLPPYKDCPGTSTTIITDNTEFNPFDFSLANVSSQPVFLQVPNSQHGLCAPDGPSQAQHVLSSLDGTLQLSQGCYVDGVLSDRFPIYPILETPPPYCHYLARMLPGPCSGVPAHDHAYRGHVDQGEMVMTDNPNYEGRVLPTTIQQYSSEHVASSTLSQDAISDMQGELSPSHLQIPTPYFGESYSQVGSSQDQHWENVRNGCTSNLASKAVYQNVNLPQQRMEEGTVNFVDNDAYDTTEPPKPPRFVISGGEKGALRETVLLKTK